MEDDPRYGGDELYGQSTEQPEQYRDQDEDQQPGIGNRIIAISANSPGTIQMPAPGPQPETDVPPPELMRLVDVQRQQRALSDLTRPMGRPPVLQPQIPAHGNGAAAQPQAARPTQPAATTGATGNPVPSAALARPAAQGGRPGSAPVVPPAGGNPGGNTGTNTALADSPGLIGRAAGYLQKPGGQAQSEELPKKKDGNFGDRNFAPGVRKDVPPRKSSDNGNNVYVPPKGEKLTELINKGAIKDDKGNAQCVQLVKTLVGAPNTAQWKPGTKIEKDVYIQPGTAIATFVNGQYPQGNVPDGERHAAIYLGQNEEGIWVVDQSRDGRSENERKAGAAEKPVIQARLIPWTRAGKTGNSNKAENFYVVTWHLPEEKQRPAQGAGHTRSTGKAKAASQGATAAARR